MRWCLSRALLNDIAAGTGGTTTIRRRRRRRGKRL